MKKHMKKILNFKCMLTFVVVVCGMLGGNFVSVGYAEDMVVRYPVPESAGDKRYEYPKLLLELALTKTIETHGSFLINDSEIVSNQIRNWDNLANGENIDIIWIAENGELDEKFIPIRIPLLKGLLGYRVFLIRQADQPKFDAVTTLDGLRKLKAGYGHDWPDRWVLEHNGIMPDVATKYELIFRKLLWERFDYFPRGVNEAWSEWETRRDSYPTMAVEKTIMLHYKLPIYFIVNKNNPQLAQRVEAGLQAALEDGSFDEIFWNYHNDIIMRANMKGRKLFRLENPFLPESTPEDARYWFHPSEME